MYKPLLKQIDLFTDYVSVCGYVYRHNNMEDILKTRSMFNIGSLLPSDASVYALSLWLYNWFFTPCAHAQ